MKLSVLICTIPQRVEMFNALHNKILQQIEFCGLSQAEVLFNNDLSIKTGEKRNQLIRESKGDFVVFVDDDDDVYDYYVQEIIQAIEKNPKVDCIGINGIISYNGQNHKKWFISKAYKHWFEKNDVFYRTPNHISPIRKSIAEKVLFPNQHHGEDFAYSLGVFPFLKKEAIIEKPMYHYRYVGAVVQKTGEDGAPYRPAWR